MSGFGTTSECLHLRHVLTTGEAVTEDARVAQAVADHIASCPTCAQAEEALSRLLARYYRGECPSLPSELERRLLDRVCSPSAAGSSMEG